MRKGENLLGYFAALLFVFWANYIHAASPPNDEIENAILLPEFVGSISNLTTTGSTQAPTDPNPLATPGSGSIWFRYNSSLTTTGVVSVTGLSSSGRIRFYRSDGGTLTFLGLFGSSTFITNSVEAGKFYYVSIQSPPATNNLTLRWSFRTLYLSKPTPPLTGLRAPGAELEFTNIETSAQFQNVSVRLQDQSGENLQIIATGTNFPITFVWPNAIAGTNRISIEATTTDGALRQSATNTITFISGNNAFTNAVELDSVAGDFQLRTVGANLEPGEPASASGSTWYRWTPAASGTAQFNIGSTNTTEFSLFTGDNVTNLTTVPLTLVTNTTIREAAVIAGQTYSIAVYETSRLLRRFRYAVTTMDFISPDPRTNINAPGIIDLAVAPLPENAQTVRYYRGSTLLGTATQPPFHFPWTNHLTGNLLVNAIAENSDGSRAYSKTAVLAAIPGNDNRINAATLDPDLNYLEIPASAYLATRISPEPTAGVWWRWIPSSNGYVTINLPVDLGAGLLVISNGASVNLQGTSRFLVSAGATNEILIYMTSRTEAGFTWTIQKSPLKFSLPAGASYTAGKLIQFTPTLVGDPAHISKVEFFEDSRLVFTATNAPFSAEWTNNVPGPHTAIVRVTLTDGSIVDGGFGIYAGRPVNDNFADAIILPGDSLAITNTGNTYYSTVEPREGGLSSIWWAWTPQFHGLATINYNSGGGARYYSVRTGDLTNYVTVASSTPPVKPFPVVAGETYYFAFGGAEGTFTWQVTLETLLLSAQSTNAWGSPLTVTVTNYNPTELIEEMSLLVNGQSEFVSTNQNFSFDWSTNTPGKYVFTTIGTNSLGQTRSTPPVERFVRPTNDRFADAPEITRIDGVFRASGTLSFATMETGEPSRMSGQVGSVWYKFIPPYTGKLYLQFTSPGSNITSRTFITKSINDPTPIPTVTSNTVSGPVIKNEPYYILFTTANATNESFEFTIIEPPSNDHLADAQILVGTNIVTFSGNTFVASNEPEEPAIFTGPAPFPTVYYRWTAPATGNLAIPIESGPAAIAPGVLFGTNWPNVKLQAYLAYVPVGFGGITCRVLAGETYSIPISAAPGPFTGHLAFTEVVNPSPSPNDFKRYPKLLTGTNVFLEDTFYHATRELDEPGTFAQTLWYTWVSPGEGYARAWLEPNEWVPTLVLDQIPTGDFYVTEGARITFRVGDYPYRWSTFKLRLTLDQNRTPPSNIYFTNRLQIPQGEYSIDTTLYGTWHETTTEHPDWNYIAWWELMPTNNGIALIEVAPSNHTELRAYARATDAWTLLASSNSIKLSLTNGSPVFIAAIGNPRNFTLKSRTIYSPPTNNNFANSIQLEGTNITSRSENYLATSESREPAPGLNASGKTVWWSWYSTDIGNVTVNLNTTFGAYFGIYSGNSVSNLVKITGGSTAKTAHTVSFQSKADTIYHILVDSLKPEDGAIELNISHSIIPFASNDYFSQAQLITGGWGTLNASARNATREPGEPPGISSPDAPTLWFDWHGMIGGNSAITASMPGASSLRIAVYTGDSLDSLQLIARGPSPLNFMADGTQIYKVSVETLPNSVGLVSFAYQSGKSWGAYPTVNLVKNGSFEELGPAYWYVIGSLGGSIGEPGAPHGRNWLTFSNSKIYQDIPTVPGKTYELRFLARNSIVAAFGPYLTVSFGDHTNGPAVIAAGSWIYPRYLFNATGETSRLAFEHYGTLVDLDAVSLVESPHNAAPEIIAQPAGVSAWAGGDASFAPVIRGTPPFQFQWHKNGEPISNATNQALLLRNVTLADTGPYHVTITNAFGGTQSAAANLVVNTASSPIILLQPAGDTVTEGRFASIAAIAAGEPPLTYQWLKNGEAIPDGTNRNLIFPEASTNDGGEYVLRIQNPGVSVLSLPAGLRVLPSTGEAFVVRISNYDSFSGAFAPVFDVDAATMLTGTNFNVQLYAGATRESLRPMGRATRFGTGFNAGRFFSAYVQMLNLAGLSEIYIQFRAWDGTRGKTYEEARAAGGRFGSSPIIEHGLHGDFFNIQLDDSFSLSAGLSEFAVGALTILERNETNLTIQLTGQPSARYLVEKNSDLLEWRPFTVITNTPSGVTQFTDTLQEQTVLYRSRILD